MNIDSSDFNLFDHENDDGDILIDQEEWLKITRMEDPVGLYSGEFNPCTIRDLMLEREEEGLIFVGWVDFDTRKVYLKTRRYNETR